MNGPHRRHFAEEVFRDYASRIYRLARQMLGNDADAEDVTSEVLLHLIRESDTLRGELSQATLRDLITANAPLTLRRQRAPREPQAPSSELARLIEVATQGLPTMYREVYVLADVEGLPNATVGEQLGLSLAEVNSRLHRARLIMREALA